MARNILDESADEYYKVHPEDEVETTPGFLMNPEGDADYILPGLTAGTQRALIRKTARGLYKKGMEEQEKYLANTGKTLQLKDKMAYAEQARNLEALLNNLPNNFQDSQLLSLIGPKGELNRRFKFIPEEMMPENVSAYYSPTSGQVFFPFMPQPTTVIHENAHKTGVALNPVYRDEMKRSGDYWDIFFPMTTPNVPDWYGVKNMGKSYQSEFLDKLKIEPFEMVNPGFNFGRQQYNKALATFGLDKNAAFEPNAFSIADMAVLSPKTIGNHNYGHGSSYRNSKRRYAENAIGIGMTKGGKESASYDRAMAAEYYPLSLEGTAMYNEMIARNPKWTKAISPKSFNRLNHIYGADWRKKALEEEQNSPLYTEGLTPIYKDEPVFDKFTSDGKPIYFYSALRNGGGYPFRVQGPYGDIFYARDRDDLNKVMNNTGANTFMYQDIDGNWVHGEAKDFNGLLNTYKFPDYKDANERKVLAKAILDSKYRVKDKNGYHYFNNPFDADDFAYTQGLASFDDIYKNDKAPVEKMVDGQWTLHRKKKR